jgi:phthalate 3,4-dioxygenase ferredoxin reductase subunit
VQTRFGTGVRLIDPQGTIRLDDDSVLDATTVVVGIGAIPNDDWLAGSGLRIDNGIVCDEYGLAAPGVYAVGDVARWYHPGRGEHVRFEHWTSALEQAARIAATIAAPERRRPLHPVEYVWSDQYDCKLQLAGRTGDEFHHIAITGPRGALAVLYADADRLAGAATLNWPRAMITLRRALPLTPSFAEAEAAVADLRR